jgi:hypothetical protein
MAMVKTNKNKAVHPVPPTPDDKRSFNALKKDGTRVRVSTRKPTHEELEAADMNHSSVFNQGLLAGLPTRAFLMRNLKKNGVWDDDAESDLTALRNEFEEHLNIIRSNKGVFPSVEAEKEFNDRKDALIKQISDLTSDFESMLLHTADTKADASYLNFLVACVTEYAGGDHDGERVYDSVSAYENDTDTSLGGRVRYEFQCVQRDLPSDLIAAEVQAEQDAAASKAKLAAAADSAAIDLTKSGSDIDDGSIDEDVEDDEEDAKIVMALNDEIDAADPAADAKAEQDAAPTPAPQPAAVADSEDSMLFR